MSPEPRKRPRRIPYSREEVANIIAFKKRKEQITLIAFKKTRAYKYQNLFNITCFFIYWEVLFCLFGPASYTTHYSFKVTPDYGGRYNSLGKPSIAELDFFGVDGKSYKFVVDEFIDVPDNNSSFLVASDFLLGKELKGSFGNSDNTYKLFSANPILLLIFIALVTSSFGYYYNLNQNSYSLMSLTVLNALTLLGLLCI